jgi:hypothetical protein
VHNDYTTFCGRIKGEVRWRGMCGLSGGSGNEFL